MPPLIFRKGLDLKEAVAGQLAASYHSPLIQQIRANGHKYESGRLSVRLAAEFGFCYGVDRAVDYANQARTRCPDRTVYLTGEIIHNPLVNDQLRGLGIRFLSDLGEDAARLGADDVVILPAFGVTIATLQDLSARGCTLVDTTCGSVLNVWKNVKRYAQEGFTSVIHGKYWHEETEATASQALQYPGGQYLVVYDHDEAGSVCEYIRHGGSRVDFLARFGKAVSPGFDPDLHLERIGLANQTTMLSSESLEIGERFRAAMRDRHGEQELSTRYRSFDTICSATQERQDAVILRRPAADLPHCRARVPAVARRHPLQISRGKSRNRGRGLAARERPGSFGADGRRVDARQPGGAGHRDRRRVLQRRDGLTVTGLIVRVQS